MRPLTELSVNDSMEKRSPCELSMYTILSVRSGVVVVRNRGLSDVESSKEMQRSRGNHAKEIVDILEKPKDKDCTDE